MTWRCFPLVNRIHQSPVDPLHKGPVMWIFDIFFVMDTLLNKQLMGQWLKMPWCSCGIAEMFTACPINIHMYNSSSTERYGSLFYQLFLWNDISRCSVKLYKRTQLMPSATLDPVMLSCRQARSIYPSQCWPRSASAYGVLSRKELIVFCLLWFPLSQKCLF